MPCILHRYIHSDVLSTADVVSLIDTGRFYNLYFIFCRRNFYHFFFAVLIFFFFRLGFFMDMLNDSIGILL